MTEETMEQPQEKPSLHERLLESFFFEEEATMLLSSFCMQLGWTEEQYDSAVKEIDLGFLKAKFIGRLMEGYTTDEELEEVITQTNKLRQVLDSAFMVVPEGLDKYLEDNNLLEEQQDENLH